MNEKPIRRVLLANPKGLEGDALISLKQQVQRALDSHPGLLHVRCQLTSGLDDFQAHAKRVGRANDWNGWTERVAVGLDMQSGEPHYHAIVTLADRVGMGVGKIVERALGREKRVFLFQAETHELTVIRRAVLEDRKDWQGGWVLYP